MKDAQRDLTLLVMAGETSPVRRLRIRRAWFKQGAIGAAVAFALFSLASVDYIRLRIDATDVERMRAETKRQREEIDALKGDLGGIAQQFEEIRELERKVRVIANLPAGVREARVPSDAGQGGAEDTDGANDASNEAAPPAAPDTDAAEHIEQAAPPDEELSAAISRIERRARRLSTLLPERRASLESLVAGLEDRREQLAATPSIWPTTGYVTSGYGFRTSPFTGRRQFHAGIDIAADFGTPIVAPASGRVVFAGRRGAFGRIVEIDHGFGVRTIYAHTDEVYVRVGQRVERGTRIAAVGSSGRSTGPHVHYQVKAAGRTVNPSDYIFE
ncbi:MAG TPA: peptidoglycan DD-metalloendopeptidase family protein [Myxococcota bacterium]|nr:peptidoglycan DD-metalloendopeptidase family protein [Myxococcota bacterium]